MKSFVISKTLNFLTFALLASVSCVAPQDELVVNSPQLAQRWLKASQDFDDIVWSRKKLVLNVLDNLISDSKLKAGEKCLSSLRTLRDGLSQRKLWAYQFMDASASGHSGLAYGYMSDLGHHDACLSLNVHEGTVPFAGQYCLVNLMFPATEKPEHNWLRAHKLNLTDIGFRGTIYEHFGNHSELFHHEHHTFAVCFPSTCTRGDINAIIDKTMKGRELKAKLKPNCQVNENILHFAWRQPWDAKICLGLIFAFTGFITFSTIVTEFLGESTVLRHFSAARNSRKLFTDYKDPYMQRMRYMDTFKFWYHTGGMLAHTVAFLPLVPLVFGTMQDLSGVMEYEWIFSQYAKKSLYMTQLVFLMSGIFSSYFVYPLMVRSDGKLSFVSFAFKRWLRTAPTTLGMMIGMFALSCVMRGPMGQELMQKHLDNCRTGWWKTMFFMNNYMSLSEICIPTSWSQSVDFHLWILAYYPLIWLYKRPKLGIFACLVLIFTGITLSAASLWAYDLPSTPGGRPIDMFYFIMHGDLFPLVHLGTHNNMASYFVGILLGYCFAKEIKPKGIISLACITYVAAMVTYASIFLPHIWTGMLGFTISRFWDVLYGGLFRVSYMAMFACAFYIQFFYQDECKKYIPGYVPFSSSFVYVPLGRLSYSVYLTQLIPMAYYLTVSYEYMPIDKYYLFFRFTSLLLICWMFGYYMFLLFEAPFISISKTHLTKQLAAESIKMEEMQNELSKGDDGVKKAHKLKGS